LANDHVIDVKVRADSTGLTKGLSEAEQGLQKAGAGFSKYGTEAEKASTQAQGFTAQTKKGMEDVGKSAMIMGGVLLAGVGLAIKAYADFAGRMAQVQSLSHASASDMDILTKSALTMGSAFGMSANDVADAEIEMVKAGISVKDMISGGLAGALTLAAAGQIDVGKATEIATIAMTQFGLQGKDIPHVADLLAAGADKALGGVGDLGEALKSGGLVAHQFGVSLDETVGVLSLFANNGLLGEAAGTDLRQMLLKLAAPSKQASKDMETLGLSIYDTQGHFVGMTSLAGQLHDKMQSLSEAERNAMLAHIFGARSIVGANILYQAGAQGVTDWTKAVNDSGFAAKQAAGKMDSLQGDFKKLQGAFETGLIEMGSTANGFLRPVVQGVTDAIKAFNDLPESAKGTAMGIAGVSGAGLLLLGTVITVIPKIHDTIQAFHDLETGSPRLAEGIKGVGKAALVAAGLLAALKIAQTIGESFETATKSTDQWSQAIIGLQSNSAKTTDILGKDMFASSNGRQFVSDVKDVGEAIKQVTAPDVIDNINDFGNSVLGALSFGQLHKDTQLDKTRESVKGLDAALTNFSNSGSSAVAAESFHKIAVAADKQGVSLEQTSKAFPQYMDSLRKLATEMKVSLTPAELLDLAVGRIPQKMKDAAASTDGQAKAAELAAQATKEQEKALSDLGLATDGTVEDLDKLVTAMANAGLIQISADDALRNYYASLDAVDAEIKKNGKSLDIHTEKGRANQKALDDVAGSTLALVKANAKNGDSQEQLSKTLHTGYDDLMANYAAFGITGDAADTMARKALGIPKNVNIDTAIQNYADSMAKLNGVKQAVDGITNYKEVAINVKYTESGTAVRDRASDAGWAGTSVQAQATGGAVTGPGAKGVDSERRLLAPGEHVLTDSDVDAMGGQSAVYAFRQQLHSGGGVRPTYAAAAPPAPVMTQLSNGGDMQMTGTLVLDSGEVMGTFRGIARQAAAGAVNAANQDAARRPSR
jgi:TP901 family phage tail tape measure protein